MTTIIHLLSLVTYHVAIVLVYKLSVVVRFDYWFKFQNIDNLILLAPSICSIILGFIIRKELRSPSDLLTWLYYFLVCVPTATIGPFLGLEFNVVFISSFVVIFVNLIMNLSGSYIFSQTTSMELINGKYFKFLIYSSTCFLFVITAINYGLNISKVLSFSIFSEAYEVRESFRTSKSNVGGIALYSVFWLAKVFIPCIIVFGLVERRVKLILLGVFLQLLVFSISAHKSYFFSLFMIFFVCLILKYRGGFWSWCHAFSGLTVLSLLFYIFMNFSLPIDLFVRRAIIVPGILSNWWVSFFQSNEFAFFSGSILEISSLTTYDKPAPFLVGMHYFDSAFTSANVNFAVDAYGNAGFFGVAIFSFLLLLILVKINSSATNESNLLFYTLLSSITFWSLIETSFIATSITHGMIFIVLFSLFFKGYKH